MNTNDPKKSSTTKISKHTVSGYTLFTQCSFDTTTKIQLLLRQKLCKKCLSGFKRTGNKNN